MRKIFRRSDDQIDEYSDSRFHPFSLWCHRADTGEACAESFFKISLAVQTGKNQIKWNRKSFSFSLWLEFIFGPSPKEDTSSFLFFLLFFFVSLDMWSAFLYTWRSKWKKKILKQLRLHTSAIRAYVCSQTEMKFTIGGVISHVMTNTLWQKFDKCRRCANELITSFRCLCIDRIHFQHWTHTLWSFVNQSQISVSHNRHNIGNRLSD